jgi:rubrerythrin
MEKITMTPQALFKLIVDLENDLADFYQDLGQVDRLKAFADVFSFLADHSQRHARRIEKTARSAEMPILNTDPIRELHQRLKASLREQVRNEKDEGKVMRQLARTEEVIGQLYHSMSENYRKQAAACTAIADQLEEISREEYGHRDYILEK